MVQHFLKSSAIRDFTVADVAFMSESECVEKFIDIFWGGRDCVICPHCGAIGCHYFRRTRNQWRCKDCDGYFSITSGTPFADHKIGFKRILLGMMEFISSANGISHHALARKMDVSIKTAQVFVGKLREVIWASRPQIQLEGVVQIDGGHFGGRPRHGRVRKKSDSDIAAHVEAQLQKKKKRKGRSSANWRRFQKRRVVMVIRELHPDPKMGATKTIVAICRSENEADAIQLARRFIKPGSLIMTDENPAYNQLSQWFEHRTVQHAIEFSSDDGINDNQAESYFSRLRRYVKGVSHRIEPKYMTDIAVEMAWREDMRRKTEGQKLNSLLKAIRSHGLSKWWRGYWQKFNRPEEMLWTAIQA